MEKSVVENFTSRKKSNLANKFGTHDQDLNYTMVVKFLGLLLDCDLNWNERMNSLCSTLAQSVFILKKLKGYCSMEILQLIYYLLIFHSKFVFLQISSFCIEILVNTSK